MNTSSNENGYASDDKCVFYYQLGLISSGIWSTFVVTIDAIYETSFFAPHTFCMNTSTERTMQQILFLKQCEFTAHAMKRVRSLKHCDINVH